MAAASARTRLVWMSCTRTTWAASAPARSRAPDGRAERLPGAEAEAERRHDGQHRDHPHPAGRAGQGLAQPRPTGRPERGRARRASGAVPAGRAGRGAGAAGWRPARRRERPPRSVPWLTALPPDAVAGQPGAGSGLVGGRRPGPRAGSWRSWSMVGASTSRSRQAWRPIAASSTLRANRPLPNRARAGSRPSSSRNRARRRRLQLVVGARREVDEDLLELVVGVVLELDRGAEPAGQAGVAAMNVAIGAGVAGDDDHQVVAAVLHLLDQGVDRLGAVLVAGQAVGLVDEQHPAERRTATTSAVFIAVCPR